MTTSLGLNGALFGELREAMHRGETAGADLFGADRGIGVPNGAPPAGMVLVGPEQLVRPTTAEEGRAAVHAMASRGTDLVKLWLDDFGGSLPAKMKHEVYQAVIEEAHARGLRVAAHIHDLEDAKAVARAGVDILAHGVRDKPVDADLLQLLKEHSAWYVATLHLDESTFVYAARPQWTTEPFVEHALQPAVRGRMADAAWREQTEKTQVGGGARLARDEPAQPEDALRYGCLDRLRDRFRRDPLRVAGVAEHRELALMVEAGLTPQAITVATRDASALLGLADRGVLTAFKRADLVVLHANPTSAIANTKTILAVWHRGRLASGGVETFAP